MALISAAEARDYIPGLSSTGDDTRIGLLITRADHVLATYCRLPPYSAGQRSLVAQTYTLYLDTHGGRALKLPHWPVASITSIHDDPLLTYGSDTAVSSDDYDIYSDEGLVILTETATWGAWSEARRAAKVIASLGFATAPEQLKHAAGLLVAHWLQTTIPAAGRSSMTLGKGSAQVAGEPVPRDVLVAVAPYVRYRGAP